MTKSSKNQRRYKVIHEGNTTSFMGVRWGRLLVPQLAIHRETQLCFSLSPTGDIAVYSPCCWEPLSYSASFPDEEETLLFCSRCGNSCGRRSRNKMELYTYCHDARIASWFDTVYQDIFQSQLAHLEWSDEVFQFKKSDKIQ
jgi:hypothetical protein